MLLIVIASCKSDKASMPQPDKDICDSLPITYSGMIESIVTVSCATIFCHDANSDNGDFTSYIGVKAKVDNGSLRDRVIFGDPSWMPPAGQLSKEDRDKIQCWLNDGALNN